MERFLSTMTKIQKSIMSFAVKTPQYVLIQTLSFTSNKEITARKSMDLVDLGRHTNSELDEAVVWHSGPWTFQLYSSVQVLWGRRCWQLLWWGHPFCLWSSRWCMMFPLELLKMRYPHSSIDMKAFNSCRKGELSVFFTCHDSSTIAFLRFGTRSFS